MRTAALCVLSWSSLALAESPETTAPSPQHAIGIGAYLGTIRDEASGLYVDGARELRDSWYLRAQIAAGQPVIMRGFDNIHYGYHVLARAGIEARRCTANHGVCGFAGTDVGYLYEKIENRGITPMLDFAHELVAVPRAGVELGKSFLRLRVTVEVPLYVRVDDSGGGAGLLMGLGYAASL
jgi:hypothetical protein